MLSNRIKGITKSSIVKFDYEIKQREKKGIKFIKANIGQPDFPTDISYYNNFKTLDTNIANSYSDAEGLFDLRDAFAKFYKNIYSSFSGSYENIIVTQGASDAIIKVLYSICDVGDEIIVLEPFFSDYKIYSDVLQIRLKSISYNSIVDEKIQKLVSSKTRAILFANPNNPDGSVLTKKQIDILLQVSRHNNLYLISDEVYSCLQFDDNYHSLSSYDFNNSIIIDSASKKLNSCGSRIGFVISKNRNILDAVTCLNDSRISISYSEQYTISKMLKNPVRVINKQRTIYKKRFKVLSSLLNKYNIEFIESNGGLSVLIILPVRDCDKFMTWVVKEYEFEGYSYVATPAKDFYLTTSGNNKLRLSLTVDEAQLNLLVLMIKDSLDKYGKGDVI